MVRQLVSRIFGSERRVSRVQGLVFTVRPREVECGDCEGILEVSSKDSIGRDSHAMLRLRILRLRLKA